MLANSRNSFSAFDNSGTFASTPIASSGIASSSVNIAPGFLRPTLNVPSPRQSPKVNPFSSPSPAHNPFVSIVETKDVLWRKINDSTESHTNSNSNKFEFRDYGSGSSISGSTNGDSSKISRKNGSHDDSMAAPTVTISPNKDEKVIPVTSEVENDVSRGIS